MKRFFLLALATLFLATACNSKDSMTGAHGAPVMFHRFEQLIFSTPQKQLHNALVSDSAICSCGSSANIIVPKFTIWS